MVVACAEDPGEALRGAGIEVVCVRPRFTALSERNPGGRPETQPGYPYDVLGYAAALSHQMADEVLALLQRLPPPDVIECQEFGALPYFLLQRKLTQTTPLATIPILVHLHGPAFELARLNREPTHRFPEYWIGRMERFCIVAADALLSPSRFLADGVSRALGHALDIAVVPHPFAVPEAPASLPTAPRGVVCVGRLQAVKGVVPLLEACDRLWDRGESFPLTLVGDDASYAPTGTTLGAHLAERYGRRIAEGRLQLVGRVAHDLALQHMQRAAVVVVPSLFENFPNTCLEAMSLGQVVLATRSGGQAEMIGNQEGGLLFDWETPGDFERQLARALELGDAERRAIGNRARARLLTLCDPRHVLEQRLQHYAAIAATVRRRRTFPTVVPLSVERSPSAVDGAEVSMVIVGGADPGALAETLASVRASTRPPLEIGIGNHAGTPARASTVGAPLTGEPASVRSSSATASPAALAKAAPRGALVAFVRAGDLVEPEFLARAATVLNDYDNVGFVYAWVRYREPATGIWPTWNAELPYALGHTMVPSCVVIRRAALEDWGDGTPASDPHLEDLDGWLDLLAAGWAGVSLPDLLVRRRAPRRSAPGGVPAPIPDDYERAARRHATLYQSWAVDLFHLQNANGPGVRWYHPAAPSPLADPLGADDVRWIDYEIGGRLVSRLRRTWIARRLLRRPGLRRLLRRVV